MILPLSEHLMNIITWLYFYTLASLVFEHRGKSRILTGVLGCLVMGIAMPVCAEFVHETLGFAMFIVFYPLFFVLAFEGRFLEKISVFAIAYGMAGVIGFVMISLYDTLGWDSKNQSSVDFFIIYICLMTAAVALISGVWNNMRFLFTQKGFASFFLLPLSQCGLVMMLMILVSKTGSDDLYKHLNQNKWIPIGMLFFACACLVGDVLFLRSAKKATAGIKEQERMRALELECRVTYDNIKSMENDVVEMRRYRHDFVNLLTAVQLSIESGSEEGRQDALALVRKMTSEISGITGRRYCANSFINGILGYQEKKMTDDGISCELHAEIPEELPVSEVDICRLLTNLLDNAHESCMKLTDASRRSVRFNMRIIDGYLFVTVQNSRPEGELSLQSQKQDKGIHGLGLSIVESIAKEHGGELLIAPGDDTVQITATMRCELP